MSEAVDPEACPAGALSPRARIQQLQAELNSLHKAITVVNHLAAELDIHAAMENVRQVALELLDCDRVTLFLIFDRRKELRAKVEDRNELIRVKFGEGIAGLLAQTGGCMNLPDVYEHPMFNKEVDRLTGYRTRSMLCMAIADLTGKNVAVLQALNKSTGAFSESDERHLKLFGTHLGNTLVKAKLHETAKREKERLQAIYNCFKSLSAADDVSQVVTLATTALERQIIHAEKAFFFLVDHPRQELWLHTHQVEPIRLRMGQGVVGDCAQNKKAQAWVEFDGASADLTLQRLQAHVPSVRVKSVLVQPIHANHSDKVLGVVMAVNKREAEGTSDIFFEPFFTDADCDAMALFAYEVGDLLSERSLELSLLSALSVVAADGTNANTMRQASNTSSTDGDGGLLPPAPTSDGALQLIQMYIPELRSRDSHGGLQGARSSQLPGFCASFSAPTGSPGSMGPRRMAAGLLGTRHALQSEPPAALAAAASRFARPQAADDAGDEPGADEGLQRHSAHDGVGISGSLPAATQQVLWRRATSERVGTSRYAAMAHLPVGRPGHRRPRSTHQNRMQPQGFLGPGDAQEPLVSRSGTGDSTSSSSPSSSRSPRRRQASSSSDDGVPLPKPRSRTVARALPTSGSGDDDASGRSVAGGSTVGPLPGSHSGAEDELQLPRANGDTRSPRHPAGGSLASAGALRSHLSVSDFSECPHTPCFHSLEQMADWDWDFTAVHTEELIKLVYDIFIASGTIDYFGISPKVLRNFVTAVASHYHHGVPYHNFNHACHVLHAVYLLAYTTSVRDMLKPLDQLGLLLAALCHDLDHDGHSNSYHVNSSSELARIYNDQSVMENHHCAMTFAILSRKDCNLLSGMAPEDARALRKVVIAAILCTDMANHFALTQEFTKRSAAFDPESEADRLLLIKAVLHAGDIGNAVRPFHVNQAMSRRVHREFEVQAAEEVAQGLPVTFSVDTTDHVMCARIELNFLDYVVTALWERLVEVLPEVGHRLEQLRLNRKRYRIIAETGKTADQVLAEEALEAGVAEAPAQAEPNGTAEHAES